MLFEYIRHVDVDERAGDPNNAEDRNMYLQLVISSTTRDESAAVKVAIHCGCRPGRWQIQMFEVLLFEERKSWLIFIYVARTR